MHGDCIELLATLPADSIDACVTDPPYGIGFMGKEWDTFKPESVRTSAQMKQRKDPALLENQNIKGRKRSPAQSPSQVAYDYTLTGLRGFQAWTEQWAREMFRVLKPGAHIVVCGAPRAYHRMASGLEDAGFEIRDCLAWLFGSGFPKSLNLGEGLGTALKPAHEPIVLARKPFKSSVKTNVEKYGTGALNIDACRVEGEPWEPHDATGLARDKFFTKGPAPVVHKEPHDLGRWPANVVIDDLAAMVIDEQSGELHARGNVMPTKRQQSNGVWGAHGHSFGVGPDGPINPGDSGGASRFYYCAKPSREERDMGCYALPERSGGEATARKDGSEGLNNPRAGAGRTGGARNYHPTVKPIELMRWLVKLVTPVNGTVIDPFLGSGTTGIACRYELRGFIGIEREVEYLEIARRRIASAVPLFGASA